MSKSTLKETTKPMAPEATSKPSNADYPVEPAERVSQQERLRKAAAAGANALKSPLPAMISGMASRPEAKPEKPLEPVAALTQPVSLTEGAPNPDRDPCPEIPTSREVAMVQMHDPEAILSELRKISAWADMQRKITKWTLMVIPVAIAAMIGIAFLMEERAKTALDTTVSRPKPDWYDVDRNVRLGEFDKAIAIGEELILKTPQYPEAHQRLAAAYLASGNLEKAREHYAEAFRLFPSEENEKPLTAIDKRNRAE